MTSSGPGPVAAKQAHMMLPPPPCLTAGGGVSAGMCLDLTKRGVWFYSRMLRCFVQMQFCELQSYVHVLCRQRRFLTQFFSFCISLELEVNVLGPGSAV